jgi:hypothetical protein
MSKLILVMRDGDAPMQAVTLNLGRSLGSAIKSPLPFALSCSGPARVRRTRDSVDGSS